MAKKWEQFIGCYGYFTSDGKLHITNAKAFRNGHGQTSGIGNIIKTDRQFVYWIAPDSLWEYKIKKKFVTLPK